MATLVITEGPAAGQQFALGEHRIVMVGRDDECTFQVLDAAMSRRHMQVKRNPDDEGHVAVDFGSANGVEVNRKRITDPVPLVDGDEIRLGDTGILYTTKDAPDAATVHSLLRRQGEHMRSTIVPESERR